MKMVTLNKYISSVYIQTSSDNVSFGTTKLQDYAFKMFTYILKYIPWTALKYTWEQSF